MTVTKFEKLQRGPSETDPITEADTARMVELYHILPEEAVERVKEARRRARFDWSQAVLRCGLPEDATESPGPDDERFLLFLHLTGRGDAIGLFHRLGGPTSAVACDNLARFHEFEVERWLTAPGLPKSDRERKAIFPRNQALHFRSEAARVRASEAQTRQNREIDLKSQEARKAEVERAEALRLGQILSRLTDAERDRLLLGKKE